MLSWYSYVTGNNTNHTYKFLKEIILHQFALFSHITQKCYTETKQKKMFICSWLLQTYNLAKQIIMTHKSLCSFSLLTEGIVKEICN